VGRSLSEELLQRPVPALDLAAGLGGRFQGVRATSR
jgi:hypothetical protein